MSKTVAIALGGSGGHIFPAREMAKSFPEGTRVLYIGVGLSANPFFEREGVDYIDLKGSRLKGNPLKTLVGIWQAVQALRKEKIDFVLGMGSFHSFPAMAAALLLKIPYALFEPNIMPGQVNRLLSRWAEACILPFSPLVKPMKGKSACIDCRLSKRAEHIDKEEALAHFGLTKGRTTLLVFGGSQGAKRINQAMREMAGELKEKFQILHFTGKEENLKEVYDHFGIPSFVAPFCSRMDLAWSASDFGICRAGAGTLREMVLYKKGALLIPYKEAKDNHQYYNALFMQEKIGGGRLALEENLNAKTLFKALQDLPKMERALELYNHHEQQPHIEEVFKRWL